MTIKTSIHVHYVFFFLECIAPTVDESKNTEPTTTEDRLYLNLEYRQLLQTLEHQKLPVLQLTGKPLWA